MLSYFRLLTFLKDKNQLKKSGFNIGCQRIKYT